MSNYTTTAINPGTGKEEEVVMLDNYYGRHRYGVMFQDGTVRKEQDVEFPTRRTPSPQPEQ